MGPVAGLNGNAFLPHFTFTIMKTEEQKKKNKEYMRDYHDRPDIKTRHKKYMKEYNNRPEVKEKFKKYMRNYFKGLTQRKKNVVRMQSQRIYGKVEDGYERHHIDYDSPHNFVLMKIKSHKKIHEELNKSQWKN